MEKVEIDDEGEQLLESFKKELNLTVVEENQTKSHQPVQKQNMLKMALSVFQSKEARKEYLTFLKNLLKV